MHKRWFRSGKRLTSTIEEEEMEEEEKDEEEEKEEEEKEEEVEKEEEAISSTEEEESLESTEEKNISSSSKEEEKDLEFPKEQVATVDTTLPYTVPSPADSSPDQSPIRKQKKVFHVPIRINAIMDGGRSETEPKEMKEYSLFPRGRGDADKIESVGMESVKNEGDYVQPIGTKKDDELVSAFEKMVMNSTTQQDKQTVLNTRITDLPTFGDKNLTVKQFFMKFERYAILNGWTDDQRALILPTCLVNRALSYYDTLTPGVQKDYKQCKDKFMDHFNAPEELAKRRTMLFTEKQGDMNLDEYLTKIEQCFGELGLLDVVSHALTSLFA